MLTPLVALVALLRQVQGRFQGPVRVDPDRTAALCPLPDFVVWLGFYVTILGITG